MEITTVADFALLMRLAERYRNNMGMFLDIRWLRGLHAEGRESREELCFMKLA